MASQFNQADSAKHMYDARASKYDDSWHPNFAKHIVDSLDLKPGEKLLDLACGTGLVTLPAARQVGPEGLVVGVDISDGMLQELQSKLLVEKETFPHVKTYKHDITRLEGIATLEKGTFDAISCTSALVILREPGVALQKWSELLKPGGRLITDVTHVDNLPAGNAFERVYYRLSVEPPFNRDWVKGEASFRRVLQQAGLEVEKIWLKAPAGLATNYLSIDEADTRFDAQIYSPSNKALVDRGLVDEARQLFREEWKKLANKDGKIVDLDGVFVGIARKPLLSTTFGKGSCACGAISWTATAEMILSCNCHFSICRKISGSPYVTFANYPQSSVTFSPPLGKPHLKTFAVSPYAERTFCGECGSNFTMWYKEDPDTIDMAIGTLDEGKSTVGFYKGPQRHIYTGDVPSWYRIPEDDLKREETMEGVEKLFI